MILSCLAFDYPDRDGVEGQLKWWQQLAPYEVNEIIKAVNTIQAERCRAILVMSYLVPHNRANCEQMDLVNVKSSQFYKLKQRALLEFARLYRDGALIELE